MITGVNYYENGSSSTTRFSTVFNGSLGSKLVEKSVENRWASPNYFAIGSTVTSFEHKNAIYAVTNFISVTKKI
jgi:hypothetical protein